MVLIVSGVTLNEPPDSSRTLFELAPVLKESASQFASALPKQLGPQGLIYVAQREFAVVNPNDKTIQLLGTQDCTTCLALVLRHPVSGAVALAHMESCCVDGISSVINRLQDCSLGYFDSTPLQMHIFGSFADSRRYSEDVIYSLLHYCIKQPIEIELMTACVGELNTIMRNDLPWPIVYGIGIDTKSGDIFPATFLDKGPDLALRGTRIFSGTNNLLEIYDFTLGLMRIGPFHYEPIRSIDIMLRESDEFILQNLTTSPEVEAPHVVHDIKSTLRYIQTHPFPEITVFSDNRPRYYRKDENTGEWIPIRLNYNEQM